ncbi:troponin C, isoallergen Bla g 6.0201 isoform X1 [Dendroctonus ponderosae]|uniref:EF-hand domain-containing protein n=1 Tax=Dendroctonus ponderosae TaxID=77166 RepID=A0AAR5P012_DENPD|nr:troponin C, isoallergen Bla g 6.0201 isoform X1 [Dendroctonus ponderosae]XP_048519300.1 troponin C, isoallergen Bla g 6.0201 isoform X1 [Dendroctonus ponderosae]
MSTRKLSLQKVMSFVESVDECGIVNMDDLDKEQLLMLKSTFDAFDVDKKGFISVEMIGTIMDMLGTQLDSSELEDVIEEIDEDGNGEVSFEEFANLAARFLIEEEEDTDAIQTELKGAFRMYDREGNGFITIEVLREILQELDEKLTDDDLDSMIDEIDIDGSGTVDWEEFKAVMIG